MKNLIIIMGLLLVSKFAFAGCFFICPKPKKLVAQITLVHIEAETSSGWLTLRVTLYVYSHVIVMGRAMLLMSHAPL